MPESTRTLREPWQFAVLAGAAVLLLGPARQVVRRGVVLTLLAAAATGVLVALAGGRCHNDAATLTG